MIGLVGERGSDDKAQPFRGSRLMHEFARVGRQPISTKSGGCEISLRLDWLLTLRRDLTEELDAVNGAENDNER